jgi:hypothetical protein
LPAPSAGADAAEQALAAALERRARVLDVAGAPRTASGGAWESATRLELRASLELEPQEDDSPAAGALAPRPGLVLLDGDALAVQGRERVTLVEAGVVVRTLDPLRYAGACDVDLPRASTRDAWPWPLVPASDGRLLALVVGRADAARGNALVCLDPGAGGRAPARRWSLCASATGQPDGTPEGLRELLDGGRAEFQPGPVIADGTLFVQVRRWGAASGSEALDAGRIEAWCLALELESGALRWKRLLATGADLAASRAARRGALRDDSHAAPPLAVADGRVLVSTALGVVALLDACDGRLAWALRYRRRTIADDGWLGASPAVALAPADAGAARDGGWLWAPPDSDCLYRTRDRADLDGRGVGLGLPRPLAAPAELVAGPGSTALVLSRAAGRVALASFDLDSGATARALELGREERVPGAALCGAARAVVASERGLCIYDRTRGLRLLDELAWQEADAAGSVFARDDELYVVAPGRLTIVRAR